jgi:hypothetical protein
MFLLIDAGQAIQNVDIVTSKVCMECRKGT